MAEILLCVKDMSTTGTQAVDVIQPMAGDVIVAVNDGWTWGELELGGPTWFNPETGQRESVSTHPQGNHSFFRVIKLPNLPLATAQALLAREPVVDPANPSPFLHFRQKFIDKSKIPAVAMKAMLDHWNDDTRTQGFISLQHSAGQINALISTRSAIKWP